MATVPIDTDSSTDEESTFGSIVAKTKGTLALAGSILFMVFLVLPARVAGEIQAEMRTVGKWTGRAASFAVSFVVGYVVARVMSAILQMVFNVFQERIENDAKALAAFVALQMGLAIAVGAYLAVFGTFETAAYREKLKELDEALLDDYEQVSFDEVQSDD